MSVKNLFLSALVSVVSFSFVAQSSQGKIEQLGNVLPTPNSYRAGSGAPGEAYWQQRADYVIDVELNDETQVLTGRETITYHNNSPEALTYLWLQLDQNILEKNSITSQTKTGSVGDSLPTAFVAGRMGIVTDDYNGGYTIKSV